MDELVDDEIENLIKTIRQRLSFGQSLSAIHDDLIQWKSEEQIFFCYVAAKMLLEGNE